MQKITPFLWFDGNLEETVNFYTTVFPTANVESMNPMSAAFVIEGQPFYGAEWRTTIQIQ